MINHVLRNALKFTASPMILSLEREAYGGSGALWCSIYGKTELYLAQSHPDRVRAVSRRMIMHNDASHTTKSQQEISQAPGGTVGEVQVSDLVLPHEAHEWEYVAP